MGAARRDGSPTGFTETVDRLCDRVAADGGLPALSWAVATPDGVLHSGATGFADLLTRRPASPDDQYPWFSMTKIATATAAVRLHESGALDLDAPISSCLPDYLSGKRGTPTTRQLLNHTAGLANPLPVRWVHPEGVPDDPAVLARVVAKHGRPRRPVGGPARYSNVGYLLAARVIEAVTGQTVQEYVEEAVLRPLRMERTGYAFRAGLPRAVGYVRVPRPAVPLLRAFLPRGIVGPRVGSRTALNPFLVSGAGFGGLVGPVGDAVLLAAALAAAPGDPHPVLGHESVAEMRTITEPGKPFDHGLGWFRPRGAGDAAYVEHYGTGGGFWNAMRIYPERRLAMVAMTNSTSRWDFGTLFAGVVEAAP